MFNTGRSPGLVVMGGDSCSEACGFISQYRIVDGHFLHLFAVKCNFCTYLEKTKINEKRPGMAHLKNVLYNWSQVAVAVAASVTYPEIRIPVFAASSKEIGAVPYLSTYPPTYLGRLIDRPNRKTWVPRHLVEKPFVERHFVERKKSD